MNCLKVIFLTTHTPLQNTKQKTVLFKVLMEEQKMTILQRNKLEYYLRTGSPLPPPTTNKPKPDSVNRRHSFDFRRIKMAQRRTLDIIKASGALDYEK